MIGVGQRHLEQGTLAQSVLVGRRRGTRGIGMIAVVIVVIVRDINGGQEARQGGPRDLLVTRQMREIVYRISDKNGLWSMTLPIE